ncbi:unnamed protein product [Durusdinium trenchii]|uniref:Uncharacterized protein n=1 Tax=Durusdinium trenchii TaxID=1381693 RepID=A0ABP0LW91_9DINO
MDSVQWLARGDDEKPIPTREAEDRESCVSALLGLVPAACLAESDYLLVARLLLSVHNDLQLFSLVQLPFCAHDATALRRYTHRRCLNVQEHKYHILRTFGNRPRAF